MKTVTATAIALYSKIQFYDKFDYLPSSLEPTLHTPYTIQQQQQRRRQSLLQQQQKHQRNDDDNNKKNSTIENSIQFA